MSVLKIFAEPLLKQITPLEVQYSEACRLLRFLDIFPTIDPTDPKVDPEKALYPIVFDGVKVEEWKTDESEYNISDNTQYNY